MTTKHFVCVLAPEISKKDATLQLVPCFYRFKMPRVEEQNINIYIFKSLCRHQCFKQKSLDGRSCGAASFGPFMFALSTILSTQFNRDSDYIYFTFSEVPSTYRECQPSALLFL